MESVCAPEIKAVLFIRQDKDVLLKDAALRLNSERGTLKHAREKNQVASVIY